MKAKIYLSRFTDEFVLINNLTYKDIRSKLLKNKLDEKYIKYLYNNKILDNRYVFFSRSTYITLLNKIKQLDKFLNTETYSIEVDDYIEWYKTDCFSKIDITGLVDDLRILEQNLKKL